jgi:hypothetical protein
MYLELPDCSTGEITFLPSSRQIGQATTEDLFARSPEAQRWTAFVDTPEHRSFKLDGTWSVDGVAMGVIVWFDRAALVAVEIFPRLQGQSWSTWSEQDSLAQRDQLELLLKSSYREQRTFCWGQLSATYDPRSGSSSIVVRYRNAPLTSLGDVKP